MNIMLIAYPMQAFVLIFLTSPYLSIVSFENTALFSLLPGHNPHDRDRPSMYPVIIDIVVSEDPCHARL